MQGRKRITQKIFYQVSLESLVEKDNFYRKLSQTLDLHFLYKETTKYFNNINSDKKLIEFCSNCLDVRWFLGYDIDEKLPWHSRISPSRQLYSEEVFLKLFQIVLFLCVQQGMVRGKRQALDSAVVKANASMDSLVEKQVIEDVSAYTDELNENSDYKVSKQKKEAVERQYKRKSKYVGKIQAHKHVLMVSLCYNLKKIMKFGKKTLESRFGEGIAMLEKSFLSIFWLGENALATIYTR